MTRRRKPRLGRPPLPPGEAKASLLRIRLTEADHDLLRRAADRVGDTVSEYVRETAIVMAREELGMDPTRR